MKRFELESIRSLYQFLSCILGGLITGTLLIGLVYLCYKYNIPIGAITLFGLLVVWATSGFLVGFKWNKPEKLSGYQDQFCNLSEVGELKEMPRGSLPNEQ
jgi:hypothetical protein